MEILLQSRKIKDGTRENCEGWIQEKFSNIINLIASRLATTSSNSKQENIIIEHVCGIEIQRQKSNAKLAYEYEYNCELSILKNFVNRPIEQQNSKNSCPRAMHNGRSLIKSQSMPDLF